MWWWRRIICRRRRRRSKRRRMRRRRRKRRRMRRRRRKRRRRSRKRRRRRRRRKRRRRRRRRRKRNDRNSRSSAKDSNPWPTERNASRLALFKLAGMAFFLTLMKVRIRFPELQGRPDPFSFTSRERVASHSFQFHAILSAETLSVFSLNDAELATVVSRQGYRENCLQR
jgi:hypothetical protein